MRQSLMGLAREGRGAWSRQRRSWASRECIGVSKRHEKVLMWRIGTVTSRKGRMVLRETNGAAGELTGGGSEDALCMRADWGARMA